MAKLTRNPSTVNTMTSGELKHGAYHLANLPELYEPQRSNHFDFVVTGLDSLVKAGMNADEEGALITNAQEVLRMSVQSAPVPHFKQNALSIKKGNTSIYFAGSMEFGGGNLTVQDYIGADTLEILMAWQNLSGDPETEKVGLVTDYKKEAYLIEYSPDYQVVRKWVLKGCWITGLSESDFNSESNELRKITVNIQYDKGYIDRSEI